MTPIEQSTLLALGFNQIVWNGIIPAYWLTLRTPETGDYFQDRQFAIEVRYNEFKDDPPELGRVYLLAGGMVELKHIRGLEDLLKLIELLSGRHLGSEGE